MPERTPLENIAVIAQALGDLLPEVVFVGGATLELYLDTSAPEKKPAIRPTLDVDCVIQTGTKRSNFYKWEEQIRKIGFKNSLGPICRYVYKGIIVDFMPTDSKILGFSNSWYSKGFDLAKPQTIPGDHKIRLLPLAYFLATKCEAFLQRGATDLYASKDLEDIVFLLAYGKSVKVAVQTAPTEIKKMIDQVAVHIEKNLTLLEVIEAHIDRSATQSMKQQVLELFKIAD